jgi:hypothetical protein
MTQEHQETYNKLDRYKSLAKEIRNDILDRITNVVETDPDYDDDDYDLLKQTEIEFLERLATWVATASQVEHIKTALYKFDKLRSNESMPNL